MRSISSAPNATDEVIERQTTDNSRPRVARHYARWAGIALLFLLVVFSGLGVFFQIYTRSQQDAVLEAVLRDNFKYQPKDIIFVSVDGHDPPDSFFARFKNDEFFVKKWSQAKIIPSRSGRRPPMASQVMKNYLDKDTGEAGMPLILKSPTWSFPLRASVSVNHEMAGSYFIVVRRNGRWVVAHRELAWIA